MKKLGLVIAGGIISLGAFAADEGVTLGGYIDAGYTAYMLKQAGGQNVTDANGFLVREAGVYLGKKWGDWEVFSDFLYRTQGPASVGAYTISQAFVSDQMENGFGWKLGKFDGIYGYYAGRSDAWAHRLTDKGMIQNYFPTSHIGWLGTYSFSDMLKIHALVANSNELGADDVQTGVNLFGSQAVGTNNSSTRHPDLGLAVDADFDSFKVNLGVLFMTGDDSDIGFEQSSKLGYAASAVVQGKFSMLDIGVYGMYFKDDFENIRGESKADVGFGANVGYDVTDKLGLNLRGEYISISSGKFLNPITKTWVYDSAATDPGDPKSALAGTLGAQWKFNDAIKGRIDYSLVKTNWNNLSVDVIHIAQAGVVANF